MISHSSPHGHCPSVALKPFASTVERGALRRRPTSLSSPSWPQLHAADRTAFTTPAAGARSVPRQPPRAPMSATYRPDRFNPAGTSASTRQLAPWLPPGPLPRRTLPDPGRHFALKSACTCPSTPSARWLLSVRQLPQGLPDWPPTDAAGMGRRNRGYYDRHSLCVEMILTA